MPDSKDNQDGNSPEFEVAYYTKELGKSLQREMLQKQISQLGDDRNNARNASVGDDAVPAAVPAPPSQDRPS